MKRILVTPLNWGLGHATRCIPLIRSLEEAGAEVILASDGYALDLLRLEFPHLSWYQLPAYKIRYGSKNMVRNMAWQLPRLVYAIRAEQLVTHRLAQRLGIHGILSDNRYGCFSKRVPSVLLTHQLHLRIPFPPLEWLVNRLLELALSKFDAVWVPDAAGEPNLSGDLSHGGPVHPHTHFTGVLSRMQNYPRELEYDVAVVLSGPEPQRSMLEQRLLEQAMSLTGKFIFIQGKTKSRKHYFAAENIEMVSYLTSRELNDVLLASETIVCRSGYSSIMDLAALGKKAILVPTPGQTEQEYLGRYFSEQKMFVVQQQDALNLRRGLADVASFSGIEPDKFPMGGYDTLLKKWLETL